MWRYGFGLRSTPVGAERVPKGTQHPVGVIRWLYVISHYPVVAQVVELLMKTNPAWDFNSKNINIAFQMQRLLVRIQSTGLWDTYSNSSQWHHDF